MSADASPDSPLPDDEPAPEHVEDEDYWRDEEIDFNPCASCDALCCSFRRGRISYLGLEPGERYDSKMIHNEHLDELLLEDGEPIDARWFIVEEADEDARFNRHISFECAHLEDGLCGVYEDRPAMCRRFECGAFAADDLGEAETFLEEQMTRPDGELEGRVVREVTERVTEIIESHTEGAA